MTAIGIIGGTGLCALQGLEIERTIDCETSWGKPSAPIVQGRLAGREVYFLARHGNPHVLAPHKVNYRANIQALHDAGVRQVIAVNAVGGISAKAGPEVLAVPHDVIDYTWGREHTFFAENLQEVVHVDFSKPYTQRLRAALIDAASSQQIAIEGESVYGCTQGPRLESPAEIERMARDGCDLVGMTGMPEAGLARELGMDYAALCLVVNWAAGRTDEEITMEDIHRTLESGMAKLMQVLGRCLHEL